MLSFSTSCDLCQMQLSKCATISATVNIHRFMSPCCLSKLLYCSIDTAFCTCIKTVITYINKLIRVAVISFITELVYLIPAYLARSFYHNRLLFFIFIVYLFVLHVPVYWLFIGCLFWGAGHIPFSPSIIWFCYGMCPVTHALSCCVIWHMYLSVASVCYSPVCILLADLLT